MRIDLADLQLFLCIADAGSITHGAARANLALASASERLRNIEAAAGVPLLQRHARGVMTTEAGEALAHHARLMLHQRSLLQGELRDFAAGARGTLQLYANTAALTEYLPGTLAPWLASRPRLHVDLKERTSVEIVRAITAGLAEAGIVSDAVEASGLIRQAVAEDHLVLIVPTTHPLASRRTVAFADVLGEPFVGLAANSALHAHLDDHARAAGRMLAVRIRMHTYEGICEMVSNGIGVSILPRGVARRLRARHAYRIRPLMDNWARRQLCLCYRDWSALSAPMQSLLLHLGQAQEA
ncbi:LysR family transcriptional regulator [Pseudomonas sp. BAY1663]|uniref:LysR family transcriptional regulator n=1 Tax=Pseudomonas sp. BAY1663 TaxID=1439940 RepID=UPI00042DFF8E|nr:LysR family transcriptional regulator [Pseudomonas sp. BAY1663]EXF44334.1 LysR family transcriptional regulator [Pseudomonas sp. BAY1663]